MQPGIQAAYIKIARDPDWVSVVNTKVFDATRTSVIRVFKHLSGQVAVYAMSSTDGKASKAALAAVLHSVAEALPAVATEAGCVGAATEDAIAKVLAAGL